MEQDMDLQENSQPLPGYVFAYLLGWYWSVNEYLNKYSLVLPYTIVFSFNIQT